jgi:hypothetical protein
MEYNPIEYHDHDDSLILDFYRKWGYGGRGWYFWDDYGVYCYGPFATQAEAEEKWTAYVTPIIFSFEDKI